MGIWWGSSVIDDIDIDINVDIDVSASSVLYLECDTLHHFQFYYIHPNTYAY